MDFYYNYVPPDLLRWIIANYLRTSDRMLLRMTCRALWRMIAAPEALTRRQIEDEIFTDGHLHLFVWVHTTLKMPIITEYEDLAVEHEHTDFFQWISENRPEDYDADNVEYAAIVHADDPLYILKWLQRRGHKFTTDTIERACDYCDASVVEWLLDQGVELSEGKWHGSSRRAARAGGFDIIRLFARRGLPIAHEVPQLLVEYNRSSLTEDELAWLILTADGGTGPHTELFERVCYRCDHSVVSWMYRFVKPSPSLREEAITEAAAGLKCTTVEYLLGMGCPFNTTEVFQRLVSRLGPCCGSGDTAIHILDMLTVRGGTVSAEFRFNYKPHPKIAQWFAEHKKK